MKGDYQELAVWQKSMELAEHTYKLIHLFPIEEKFALCDQMRRAAVSIPSNIAEGHGRKSNKEFLQFLYIARGSTYELQTQVDLCLRLYNISQEKTAKVMDLVVQTSKMIRSLISYLENKS